MDYDQPEERLIPRVAADVRPGERWSQASGAAAFSR